MRIALINDYKTRISNTKTFWHYLEDNLNAKFFSIKKPFWRYHLNRYNPDIVIVNAFWGNLKIKHHPIICLIQDNYHALLKNRFLPSIICYNKIMDIKQAVKVSDYTVVNVKSLLDHYNLSLKKSCYIPMGIDGNKFYSSLMDRLKIRDKYNIHGQCYIYVGDKTDIHGWNLIEKKINETPKDTWLIVSKNNLIKLDNKNVLSFCNINQDRLRELYNAADLFYARGSIGLPAIEAMLCGLKIDVSHDIGYFENWMPDNNTRQDVINHSFLLDDTLKAWQSLIITLTNNYSIGEKALNYDR